MSTLSHSRSVIRTAAALALFAGTAHLSLHAQQVEKGTVETAFITPATSLFTTASTPTAALGYSSSVGAGETDTAETFITSTDSTQPPPRRRYGRPRYNDNSHNADGSNKYAFIGGIGLGLPTGNFHTYDTPSYGFQVGGGRNFNQKFAVLAQFDYDHFGLQANTLTNQSNLYFGSTGDGLDGNSHIWSITVDPTVSIYSSGAVGAYAVAGVGFYHKVTNFTLPTTACADVFCIYQYLVNENVDHYTSNAPGFNAGFGLTFKPSRFANERFYVEGRYVFIDNSQRQGITINTPAATAAAYTGYNLYPANSNRTQYIPIKIGIRF